MIKFEIIIPKEDKNDLEVFYGFHSTPFGKCFIGMTAKGICHLSFTESSSIETLKKEWPQARLKEDTEKTETIYKVYLKKVIILLKKHYLLKAQIFKFKSGKH